MEGLIFDSSKELDFIGMGRLCIDLNANEINRPMEETKTFTKYLGGSPANITVALSRFGIKTGFIGKISDDQFGRFILNYLDENCIDSSNVVIDKTGSVTGLAFTEIKSPTDCSILMYRDNVADLKLAPSDVSEEYIKNAKILLISGTALSQSPSREAIFLALDFARKNNVRIFFDLDYRSYSWKNEEEVSIYYNLAARKCDVILGTRDEFDMMESLVYPNNKSDEVTAGRWFENNAKIVVIKHGKEGSICYTKEGNSYKAPAFSVKALKTFGAGDSYAGSFIFGLLNGFSMEKCMEYASAAAAIVVTKHSCSDAMPTQNEIENFIKSYKG